MRVDVVDGIGLDPGVGQRDRGGPGGLGPVGPRLDHVMGVRRRAVAEDLRVRDGAASLGHVRRLEDEQRGALAHDEPVATRVERPGRRPGLVVVAGRQRPDDVEGTERERAQRDLAAAGDRRIDSTLAQVPERLADRDRTRRARVGGRQDRPADVEGDAEVGRRRPAEHGKREVRRDRLDPALEVALVLLLRVGDATERRAEIDPDPPRVGRAPRARRQAGVVEREAAGHQAELAEPVELPGGLGRHPGERVEVVDLGRHLAAERARVEAIDPLDRRAGGAQPGPERVETGPARGDDPEPGDPDAPPVGHAGGPIGVAIPPAWSASASALNVPSVRPAIGRVKARSTNAAKNGTRGRKSCSIDTRVRSSPVGSIRHVTSIPRVAPATCRKRRRRVPGSDQVRAFQVTGNPSPRTSISGRRATKLTTSEPSARPSTRRERA